MKSKEKILCEDVDVSDSFDRFYKDGVMLAMQAYAAQSVEAALKKEWIKVKDRLPEDMVKVLCLGEAAGASPSMGGAYVFISYRHAKRPKTIGERYIDNNGFVAAYVTHWMPLPVKPSPTI